jgi:hypothetical protein
MGGAEVGEFDIGERRSVSATCLKKDTSRSRCDARPDKDWMISQRLISSLRRRERLLALAWGAARLVLVVIVALAVACYVDWRVDMRRDTPWALRVGMLVGQIALALGLAWWWVVQPLVRRRTDDDVALFIEDQTPALGHRLISAVQLNRANADTAGMSPELIGVVTQEAEERAKVIDVGELTDGRLLWKAAGIVSLVAIFAVTARYAAPKTVSVLLARQILGEEEIPRTTTITSRTFEVWPLGEPTPVTFFVDRNGPVTGIEVRVTAENGTEIRLEPVTVVDDWNVLGLGSRQRAFSTDVPAHFGDFEFRIWAADGRLKPPGHVRRVPRPSVINQDAAVVLPAHCGTKPDGGRYRVAQPRGEIIGIPGSDAIVSCKSQKPLRKAFIELLAVSTAPEEVVHGGASVVVVNRMIDMELGENRMEGVGRFDMKPEESAYRIVVEDEHAFRNADPPRRGIKIVPEEPPTVALLPEQFLPDQYPGAGVAEDFEVEGVPIPMGGSIRIAYTATHPFGLGRATLQYRVNEGPWQPFPLGETPATEKTGPFDPRRGAFANSKPGDQVQFHAVPSPDPERLLPRTDGGGRFVVCRILRSATGSSFSLRWPTAIRMRRRSAGRKRA